MITVFTPTYNRADYLKKAYESLLSQTKADFEWIVVDDGSSDHTDDAVQGFIADQQRFFNVVYLKQKHGGKHRAINLAVSKAKGDFFLILDSDDCLMPNAIEMILKWKTDIDGMENIAAVSGTKIQTGGKIGKEPLIKKHSYVDASNFERVKYNLEADMAEAYRTGILRKYPFPEFKGEDFIPEGAVWGKIAEDGFVVRWYNEPIYICEYLEGGLTRSGGIERIVKNFYGTCYLTDLSIRKQRWMIKMNWFFLFNRAAKKEK